MTDKNQEMNQSKKDKSHGDPITYIRNIGQIEKHLSKVTLQLKDPDLENEWRISQILSR